MRSIDWSQTAVGSVGEWAPSLRTAVGICLAAQQPIALWWGAEQVQFHNDAYRQMLGQRSTLERLGRPGREGDPALWQAICPQIVRVQVSGLAVELADLPLEMGCNDSATSYFSFSFSPICDRSGSVAGVFCTCTDTSQRVMSDRQIGALRKLLSQHYGVETAGDDNAVLAAIAAILRTEGTERQQVKGALQRNEERSRAFIEQSSEAIWCFELAEAVPIDAPEDQQIRRFYQHGYLSECNQMMAQMYGVASPQDLIGVKLGEFLLESDPQNLAYLSAFIRSGYRLVDAESYEVDQQGLPKVFLNNLVGVIADRKLLRAWGTQRDITDRKQAEQRLQLYADVVRNTQVGIVVWQLEDVSDPGSFRLLIANPAASMATGVDFESVLGATMADRFPVLLQTPLVEQYVNVIQTKQAIDLGEVPYSEDGIVAGTYALKAFPLPNQCLGLAFENITVRKQIEAALRESQHFNQQIAEALPGILFVHDLIEQQNVYVNRQITDLLGYTSEQVQAMGANVIARIIHPDDLARMYAYFEAFRTAPAGAALGLEFQAHHADGEWRWLYAQSVVFRRTAAGEPQQILGVAIDITNRKRVEAAQHRLAAEREQLLAREQAARAQAEAANRVKDEFLAVLSHELRTPLSPILGWARLLRNGKLSPAKTAQALEAIDRNAKLQSQLIEDLLDVSRILQGKLSLNTAPVDLVAVVEAALETVRLAAEAKAIQIQLQLAPALGPVLGDAARLQQVVWNLLSNAVKFTPEGGEVRVRLEQVQSQAQIQVIDTGKGIAADFLPHVFEYFRQADSTTTRTFGGLGLGLAIARHLVELHGGTIQAESGGEGQGAMLSVRLPLARAVDQSLAAPADLAADAALLTDVRVLLVEDEEDTRSLIAFILEQAGAVVTATATATAALDLLRQQPFEALVSDIGMSEVSGYALMQQVRALPPEQNGQIPAIALTAYAGESDRQQALAAGFQQHLAKPIEPEELTAAIARLVGSRR